MQRHQLQTRINIWKLQTQKKKKFGFQGIIYLSQIYNDSQITKHLKFNYNRNLIFKAENTEDATIPSQTNDRNAFKTA